MQKTKDINYFINLFKIKKWFIIISAVIIFLISLIIAYSLPSVYESTSTILIEEQQIPQDFVRTTVTGFAEQRIQTITQQILSRAKLMEIIKQFNLYQDMKEKYTQEEIIERMRDDIRLNTISADMSDRGRKGRGSAGPGGMTIAFTISYQGKNPATVQKVAGNLASLYLEQNLKDRQEKAETTTKFLEAELKALDERIAGIGDQITKFKQKHEGALPELKAHNMAQAERLEVDIKQLDNHIRASIDKRSYLEGQLATINPDLPVVGQEAVLDPKARLYALQVSLAALLARNSEDHPDVQKIKREIAGLEKMVSAQGGQASARRQKLTQLQMELASKQGSLSPEHPEIKKLQKEIARLEKTVDTQEKIVRPEVLNPNNPAYIGIKNQIQGIDNEVAMLQKQQLDLKSKLQIYLQRMELTPKIEQEYAALLRDYQNAHSKHMEVMNKLLEARIAEGMEEHQKAEKFTLIDPAGFPEKPVSPNRILITLAGMIVGLAAGVGMVLISDQMDHSIKNADDINWITDLPVIGNISRMITPDYLMQQKRRRLVIAVSTCFSFLIFLFLVHFFYKDLWVLTAQLIRLFNKYS